MLIDIIFAWHYFIHCSAFRAKTTDYNYLNISNTGIKTI